jgi:hypothetical protein
MFRETVLALRLWSVRVQSLARQPLGAWAVSRSGATPPASAATTRKGAAIVILLRITS